MKSIKCRCTSQSISMSSKKFQTPQTRKTKNGIPFVRKSKCKCKCLKSYYYTY